MICDKLLQLSLAQEALTSAATTNVIDLGIARNIGVGEDLYVVAIVTTAFTDAASNSTMEFRLQCDNDEAFGSVDSFQIIGSFPALSAIGERLVAKLQPDKLNSRYLRGYFTIDGNGDLSTGNFTVYITKDIQAYTSYANGYTIS